MTLWLMQDDEIKRIEGLRDRAIAAGVDLEYDDPIEASAKEEPISIIDGVAAIKIEGVLTPKRMRWLDYFGEAQTVYPELESKIREAESKGAKKIVFLADSGGGDINGLYSAMETIATSPVDNETQSGYLLASAAYMLASQTGKITAENKLSLIGSNGVRTSRLSVDFIKDISNTKSPKKTPDVATEEGVKVVQEELDDIYDVITPMVANGRGVSVEKVNKDFGQGAVMTAQTAKDRGMIDAIGNDKQPATSAAQRGAESMELDIEKLKAEYPAIYNAAVKVGEGIGADAERSRVNAHLIASEAGDMSAAIEAIKDGSQYSAEVEAKHAAFARKAKMKDDRQEDNAADVPTTGEHGGEPKKDPQAEMKTGMEAACPGLEWEVM